VMSAQSSARVADGIELDAAAACGNGVAPTAPPTAPPTTPTTTAATTPTTTTTAATTAAAVPAPPPTPPPTAAPTAPPTAPPTASPTPAPTFFESGLSAETLKGATCLSVADVDGFHVGDTIEIAGIPGSTPEKFTITSVAGGSAAATTAATTAAPTATTAAGTTAATTAAPQQRRLTTGAIGLSGALANTYPAAAAIHTVPAPEAAPPAGPACFPGEAQVLVDGIGSTSMASLKRGDRVLVMGRDSHELEYESVIGFLHSVHAQTDSQLQYVTIKHTRGILRATSEHLVFITADGSRIAKRMMDVNLGDNVLFMEPSINKLVASEVMSVENDSTDTGLYAPLTASGTIIVDGAACSVYASPDGMQVPHAAAHASMFLVRAFELVQQSFSGICMPKAAGLDMMLATFAS